MFSTSEFVVYAVEGLPGPDWGKAVEAKLNTVIRCNKTTIMSKTCFCSISDPLKDYNSTSRPSFGMLSIHYSDLSKPNKSDAPAQIARRPANQQKLVKKPRVEFFVAPHSSR